VVRGVRRRLLGMPEVSLYYALAGDEGYEIGKSL
jgi:hypothetical protein